MILYLEVAPISTNYSTVILLLFKSQKVNCRTRQFHALTEIILSDWNYQLIFTSIRRETKAPHKYYNLLQFAREDALVKRCQFQSVCCNLVHLCKFIYSNGYCQNTSTIFWNLMNRTFQCLIWKVWCLRNCCMCYFNINCFFLFSLTQAQFNKKGELGSTYNVDTVVLCN